MREVDVDREGKSSKERVHVLLSKQLDYVHKHSTTTKAVKASHQTTKQPKPSNENPMNPMNMHAHRIATSNQFNSTNLERVSKCQSSSIADHVRV
jgi:hypothetical protein